MGWGLTCRGPGCHYSSVVLLVDALAHGQRGRCPDRMRPAGAPLFRGRTVRLRAGTSLFCTSAYPSRQPTRHRWPSKPSARVGRGMLLCASTQPVVQIRPRRSSPPSRHPAATGERAAANAREEAPASRPGPLVLPSRAGRIYERACNLLRETLTPSCENACNATATPVELHTLS